MLEPNVGETDRRVRQLVAGAGFLFAAANARKHPVLSLAATITAVDLAATAAARWCWINELAGVDTRALDGAPTQLWDRPRWLGALG